MSKCRICGQKLYDKPVLTLDNMPALAQHLPEASNLETDKGISLDVMQCSYCGLVQLNIEPVHYYKEVIRACGLSSTMQDFRHKQFKDFIQKYNCKKILEVGCGKGEFLSIMKEYCQNNFGIEYSDKNVQICHKQNLNVTKIYPDKNNLVFPNAPFDSFYILNFLEHIPNITEFLSVLKNNLEENAIGLIEVPNFDMMIEQNLYTEFIPDHLYYFTKDTLTFTLNYCGFDVIEIQSIWHDYILSAIVRKREKLTLKSVNSHIEVLSQELRQYIEKYDTIAVWGAGHQAFALLALTKLENNIIYIIDSAPFKQNKFSPATHIPIVSPDYFEQNMPDAVIVMAGSYSDEIINSNLRDKNINIAFIESNHLKIVKERE